MGLPRASLWFDTPHVPHGWDCGLLMDVSNSTFFCGDLFTQPGMGEQALVSGDILGPSEAFRGQMDYFSHTKDAPRMIEKLAGELQDTANGQSATTRRKDETFRMAEANRAFAHYRW